MVGRFRKLMGQLGLTPSELADRIGIQRSSISHILSGRNKPSIDFLEKLLNTFPDIDIQWLITGKENTNSQQKMTGRFLAEPEIAGTGPDNRSAADKKTAREQPEPVDHIIIVFKNNTFRLLKPSND